MKKLKKAKPPSLEKIPSYAASAPLRFPRPICLEKCAMNIKKGYEAYILKTLRAFSSETGYYLKFPHKLEGGETWSIDVKSREGLIKSDGDLISPT